VGEAVCVRGATDAEVFEAYVERFLAATLSEGQVVVMDNLGAHRPRRVRELIKKRGAELVFLPPYSPDFSPIEEAFSKIKGLACAKRWRAATRRCWWPLGRTSSGCCPSMRVDRIGLPLGPWSCTQRPPRTSHRGACGGIARSPALARWHPFCNRLVQQAGSESGHESRVSITVPELRTGVPKPNPVTKIPVLDVPGVFEMPS
jgi:transposase